jgi:hypothetical protein
MSVELRPSRNYPGRTDLIHWTHPESNTSTIIALTDEDLKTLREPRVIIEHYADDGTDALPPLSTILSGGLPAIKQHDGTFMDHDGGSWDYWELELPVTVLWEPGADA